MDKKEFAHIQRYKLFSSSKIEKVVSEIECYSEYPEYNALRSLEGLESIPIANKTRIEKIIEKYDHSREVYAALLGEIKDDLLDLNEAIYMGKEEFNLIESETEDEDTNDEDTNDEDV